MTALRTKKIEEDGRLVTMKIEGEACVASKQGAIMTYILRCVDKPTRGAYVQPPGSQRSYGSKDTARQFSTKEKAQADACGNEVVEHVCSC